MIEEWVRGNFAESEGYMAAYTLRCREIELKALRDEALTQAAPILRDGGFFVAVQ